MNSTHPTPDAGHLVRVKIFGIGTAGVAMLEPMSRGDFAGDKAWFSHPGQDHAPLAIRHPLNYRFEIFADPGAKP